MPERYTNLLPYERRHRLRREYFFRLATVVTVAAAMLLAAYAVLLLPAYLYLMHAAAAKQAHLASLKASLASADEQALAARLSALSQDASTLAALGSAPSVSRLALAALAIARPGVTLTGLAYTPAAPKSPGTLVVTGVSVTRDALRQYQIALGAASFATAADLPVSAYAKDTDIPFSITVTLASP